MFFQFALPPEVSVVFGLWNSSIQPIFGESHVKCQMCELYHIIDTFHANIAILNQTESRWIRHLSQDIHFPNGQLQR